MMSEGDIPKNQSKVSTKDAAIAIHIAPLPEVFKLLKVDPLKGLSDENITKRKAAYGSNIIPSDPRAVWYRYFIQDMLSGKQMLFYIGATILYILWLMNLAEDGHKIALGILILSFLSGVFKYQEHKRQREAMKDAFPGKTRVLRNSTWSDIHGNELVPGDIVEVNKDAPLIPADLRVIGVWDCQVNNVYLNGKEQLTPLTIECTSPESAFDSTNLAFLGAWVEEGYFRGVVVRTGSETLLGAVRKSINEGEKIEQDKEDENLKKVK